MKKQIITIAAVAVAVALLFGVYAIFLRDNGIDEVGDPFYTLTESVKNSLAETDEKVKIQLFGYDSANADWEMIYRFALSVADAGKNISVETDKNADGDFSGVLVSTENGSGEIPFSLFFKTLYDGTVYGFDGESLICNRIFSLTNKEQQEISVRPLEGFDADGDRITAGGAPFIFPSIERSGISYLTISNQHGEYSVYQADNRFYFNTSRAINYNEEMFSLLTTNCRHAVAYGKMDMPEGQSWDDFGLNEKEPENGYYSLMTTDDKDGNYAIHTVYIGKKSSSARYYFARYIGGIFKPSGKEDVADTLMHNLSKDLIYFIPADTFEGSIGLPQADIMSTEIINAIEDTTKVYNIGDIRIDLYKEGVNAVAKSISYFKPASNLAAADGNAIKTITDKVSAKSDYNAYEGGWTKNLSVFAGLTSSDAKATNLVAALAKQPQKGEYKVVFGLLRDEANGALLPAKVTVSKSYDGFNWASVENGSVSPSQSDKTVKNYEISFTDETLVKYVKISFDVPQRVQSYVVMDEIRIYGGGEDLQPMDAVGGTWKLVAPSEYINEGYNYAHLDMTNFNDFIQSIATLKGEKVVGFGFSDNGDLSGDKLKTEVLAKFGLDKPEKHFSFEYQGVVTNLYLSAPNKDGKYNAYTTFTGNVNGKDIVATTDVIVELSKDSAKWLDWGMLQYIDHSPISMYLTDISQIDITVDGKEYKFELGLDETGGALDSVVCDGKNYDVKNFKNFYESMLMIKMQGEYAPNDGEQGEEYLRIKLHSETESTDLVFYRVDAARCSYTINGVGGYYTHVTEINKVRDNLTKYLGGEVITRD